MAGLQSNPAHLRRMKQFAASDAKHDFKALFTDLYPRQAYNIGTPLPDQIEPSNNNWALLSSYTTVNLDFQKLPLNTPIKITTVSGHDYDICAFDAHDLDAIMPFLYNGGPKETNFVIDAFASSLWNDLESRRTGKSLGTINILTNRETVNDPGSKVPPNDRIYEKNKVDKPRDVQLHSYQDVSEEDIVYNAWLSNRTDFHNDFFSSYFLKLSSINYTYLSEQINMTFSRAKDAQTIESFIVTNVGECVNSIKTLTANLKKLNSPSHLFGLYLQMKRSGDSLQGLSSLDKTRKYQGRSSEVLGVPLINLATTYTYALSHDVWNCSYNLLIGASFILLTNNDNRIYVCRTGIPRDPVEIFAAEGEKLIEEHNAAVVDYTVSFKLISDPQINNYIEKLKEIEIFTTTVLANEPTSVKKDQIENENKLNNLLRELFSFSVPINFLYSQFEPKKELSMPAKINPQTVGEIMNTISSQKIIQADTNTLFERLKLALASVNFATINQINFFSTDSLITDMKANEKYMKPLLGSLSLIAHIRTDLPLLQKTLEILKNISISNYIRKRYGSKTKMPGFDYMFKVFFSVYDDLLNKTAKPSKKRERDLSDPESITFNDLTNLLIANTLLACHKQLVLLQSKMAVEGGRRRRKFKRGGFTEDETIPFLTGEFLVQRQINRLLVPIAADILEENGQESEHERKMLIEYILIGIAKFLSYQPPYTDADHISKWGPIFVEMMKPILEDSDEHTQRIKLRFFLGIWFTENPLANMNITTDSPILYWTDYATIAGHVLIDFIFGYDVYDLFGNQEPFKIKYNLDIKNYETAYESSYDILSKFLQKDLSIDSILSTAVKIELPPLPTPSQIVTGAVSQPVLITGLGLNVFKKGLSTPSPSLSIGVRNTTTPTLAPGTLSSSSKDPTLGGGNITRKIKRKRFKYKRCPTKRHFKV
jgi:hypothetical protein